MHQPLCIDYPNVTSGIRKLSAITYIKWINTIPHCHHGYSIARHISSVLKSIKVFNPITTKFQKEKLNSSQQDREGKTPYDPTTLKKPVIHQDRDIWRTWERYILNTWLLVQTLTPEGGLHPPHRGGCQDDEDGHRRWFPPPMECRNRI